MEKCVHRASTRAHTMENAHTTRIERNEKWGKLGLLLVILLYNTHAYASMGNENTKEKNKKNRRSDCNSPNTNNSHNFLTRVYVVTSVGNATVCVRALQSLLICAYTEKSKGVKRSEYISIFLTQWNQTIWKIDSISIKDRSKKNSIRIVCTDPNRTRSNNCKQR